MATGINDNTKNKLARQTLPDAVYCLFWALLIAEKLRARGSGLMMAFSGRHVVGFAE